MTSVPLRLHTVLLALAGRVDDSALGHARHLTASARIDEAAELIAGTLIAGGIPLRSSEQRELGDIFAASGADVALLDELLVSEHDVEPTHEFGSNGQPDAGVAQAIEPIKAALTDARSIHAVWRNTASGRVPGQVPQRVVLVELGAQGSPPAAAHIVAAALRNAGIRAVVEVASADVAWPDYHQQAFAAAVAVVGAREASRQEHTASAPQPEPAPEPERPAAPERHGESAGFFTTPERPAFAAHAAPEFSNGHGESAPAHAAATRTSTAANGTDGYAAPPRTNGHHRAPEQSSEPFWPQPRPEPAAEQPAEPPRDEHVAVPVPDDHAVEPSRNDHLDESPRSHHAAEPPRADHGVESPRPENGFAPPRADYPGEQPRNGYSAEPPRADRHAEPRHHEAVEPPRADHLAGPQSNGTAPEPPRSSHAAEPLHNAQPAEPRNGYPEPPRNGHHVEPPRNGHSAEPARVDRPAEPPRNGHHAEPPHGGHPAEPPRADRPAEPPRNDYPAESPNQGGNNVVNFPESEAETTAEMSRNDAQQLHQALREAEAADRGAPQASQREAVELPAADAEAHLSNRDRELLRELHAELAKREREQAAQVQLNGWHRPGV